MVKGSPGGLFAPKLGVLEEFWVGLSRFWGVLGGFKWFWVGLSGFGGLGGVWGIPKHREPQIWGVRGPPSEGGAQGTPKAPQNMLRDPKNTPRTPKTF